MYAIDFEYDGKFLSDFGYIICDFNSSSGADVAARGSTLDFEKTPIRNGARYSLLNTKYKECISSTFHICKNPELYDNDQMEITSSDYRLLSRWLNRREFLKFRIISLPKIISQPKNYTGASGTRASFTVEAEGEGLTYQWQYLSGRIWKNSDYIGYNTDSFQPLISSSNNGVKYHCVVTDKYGSIIVSDVVTLHMDSTFKIVTQPNDCTALEGDDVIFSVVANGEGLNYQWQYYSSSSGDWANITSTEYTGVKTATMSVPATASKNGLQYHCVITDQYGGTLTSEAATLHIGTTFEITTQPQNYTAMVDTRGIFTITASGNNLSYQWQYYNSSTGTWANITHTSYTGLKTATMSVPATAVRNGMKYRCVITDGYGSIKTSAIATLYVRQTDVEFMSYHFNASFNIAKIEIAGKVVGVELTMETDAPFAYGELISKTITFTESNKQYLYNEPSDEVGYIYPKVTINCANDGNLTLQSDLGQCKSIINGCVSGERIVMDGDSKYITTSNSGHNIAACFNFDFFRLGNTYSNRTNTISVSIPCSITLEYYPIIKETM